MEKLAYYLHRDLGQPPYSQVWVYTDNDAIREAARTFEYAGDVFVERGVVKVYLNPQYPGEVEVVNALIVRLEVAASGVDKLWVDATGEIQ